MCLGLLPPKGLVTWADNANILPMRGFNNDGTLAFSNRARLQGPFRASKQNGLCD